MNKSEYMKKLQEKLEQFNQGLQEEILEDYERHFAEAQAMGKSEEEIVEELGNIEDMLQEFTEEDYKQEVIPAGAADGASGERVCGEACRALALEGLMADVVLKESADEKLHIHCESEDESFHRLYTFYQYEEDGVCHAGIRQRTRPDGSGVKRVILFGKTIFSYQNAGTRCGDVVITVQIPRGFTRVQARTLSGDMEASGISVEELRLSTTSGDMELRRTVAERLVLQTASGDMELNGITAENGTIKTGSGDVDGRGMRGKTLTVGTGSGDVELRADAENYVARAGSGSISLEVTTRARSIEAGTGSGDVEVNMRAVEGAEIVVSVGSGDICITGSRETHHGGRSSRYTYGDGACKVRVSTGSGDVEVKCR